MTDKFFNSANIAQIVIFGLIAIVLLVFLIIAWWKIYVKMGLKGWLIFIPFYGYYVFCKNIGCKIAYWINLVVSLHMAVIELLINFRAPTPDKAIVYLALAIILSIIHLIVTFRIMYKFSVAFGHGIGYTFGLTLLSTIFILILGFGNSEYLGYDDY